MTGGHLAEPINGSLPPFGSYWLTSVGKELRARGVAQASGLDSQPSAARRLYAALMCSGFMIVRLRLFQPCTLRSTSS